MGVQFFWTSYTVSAVLAYSSLLLPTHSPASGSQLGETALKPGGDKIGVTEQNKREYVDCMVNWRLSRGVARQTQSLVDGLKV